MRGGAVRTGMNYGNSRSGEITRGGSSAKRRNIAESLYACAESVPRVSAGTVNAPGRDLIAFHVWRALPVLRRRGVRTRGEQRAVPENGRDEPARFRGSRP